MGEMCSRRKLGRPQSKTTLSELERSSLVTGEVPESLSGTPSCKE